MIETIDNKKIDSEIESYLPKESFDSFDPDILLRRSNHSIYVQYISTMTTTIMIDMNENQLSSSSSSSSLIINRMLILKQIERTTNDTSIQLYDRLLFEKLTIKCQILENLRSTSLFSLALPIRLLKKIWEETKNRLIFGSFLFEKKRNFCFLFFSFHFDFRKEKF